MKPRTEPVLPTVLFRVLIASAKHLRHGDLGRIPRSGRASFACSLVYFEVASSEPVVLVPSIFVTVTSTVPLPAGEVAAIEVALVTTNEVAAVTPNRVAVTRVKLLPVMVTDVPPAAGPLFGEIEVTEGEGTCALASRLTPATDATSAATIMPAACASVFECRCVRRDARADTSVSKFGWP